MKICFIQPRAYELFNPEVKTQFGGAEVQMYLHAKELAKDDRFHVSFIVADYGQAETELYDHISVHPSIRFDTPLLQQIKDFYKIFKKTDADIYLQMTLTRFSFLIALYCLLSGKKFVYLLSHDLDLNGKILKSNFLFRKISLLVFVFSNKIIAQNNYQFDTLKKYGISSRIIRSSLEGETSMPKQKEYHLWIARAEKWKRPEVFLQLAKDHPLENFCMICPAFAEVDPVYYEELVKSARSLKNLAFTGHYVHFSELDKWFSAAKTFINTSESEGFPTTFIHACKNGIPILSLSVNPDHILEEEQIGFCCHDRYDELQSRFDALNRDGSLYDAMSEHAVRYFKQHHHLSNNSKALISYILS
jgi:glycosyltransferase involved in cell wall biosynthesis